VAYVGAASGDSPEFFGRMRSYLTASGSGEVRLAPTCGAGRAPAAAEAVLRDADAVFLSGGDVERGMGVLASRRLTGLLGELHRAGKPFFGLSAGSIMLAQRWVRWRDPHDEATAEAFDCLALAPVLCDVHGEDEDWEELRMLLKLAGDGAVGYGIAAGGAIAVAPGGAVRAFGAACHRLANRGGLVERIADLAPAPRGPRAP